MLWSQIDLVSQTFVDHTPYTNLPQHKQVQLQIQSKQKHATIMQQKETYSTTETKTITNMTVNSSQDPNIGHQKTILLQPNKNSRTPMPPPHIYTTISTNARRLKTTRTRLDNSDLVQVASLNVRTLRCHESLIELEYAFRNSNLNILGLVEVRWGGDCIIRTKAGNLFCYSESEGGQKGVGFLIKENLSQNLLEFKGITDRLALIKLKFRKTTQTVIQIYALTATSDEKECETFYSKLKEVLNSIKQNIKNQLLIIGDFKSQVGAQNTGEQNNLGKYSFGSRNRRSTRLVRFCQEHNFKLVNTS